MLIIQAKQGGDNCRQNQERPQAKYRTDFKNGLWSMVSCLIQPCVKCDKKKTKKKKTHHLPGIALKYIVGLVAFV